MFNLAIFLKTFRDSFWSLFISALGLIAFVVLFVWAMLNMGTELLSFVGKFSFIKKMFEMSLGIDVSGDISVSVLFAVCFTHAVVLALTWTVIVAIGTRVTAGEVERGTADLLLTLPVNRWEVYISTSLVWVLAAGVLSFCPIAGIRTALWFFETEEPVVLSRYVAPAVNFFCLNLTIGGIACLFGSWLNRRGLAVGIVVGIIFFSAVINFVEPFIDALSSIRYLGLLNYFRPVDIVRTGEWPVTQMMVLLIVAAISWTIGVVLFSRKDIPTA